MAPTMRATVRPTGDRSPTVLPGQRRYERSRLLVAGLGLRLVRLLEPALVVRWVLWSAARLVLPSGQALGKRLPTEQIVSFTSGGIKGFLSVG